jgi:Tol biopolymer transport system component/predicted Ser/Thr protein kinase
MSLTPGSRLGPYEVIEKIGAGGMGEVYRSKDTKLNRDAALKILPEIFTADPDRRSRFTREAQVLASLNHPNIAGIYGFEDSSGMAALAMEFVDGEDLSVIIARGAMPLADVLPIARQIADALEAAHEHGIVHRDLKPQNIKIKADGSVKVLDFGLAKAFDPLASSSGEAMNSPTMTVRATQMGMIIGTAAYMSPEQARGKAVDRRADIWAFGVVVYEMLAGRRAFEGDEISDVLAAVLRQDIDWTALPATTPPRLRRLIERCLDRDAKQRLRDIGEARVEIAKIESGAPDPSGISAAAAITLAPAAQSRRAIPVVFGVVFAVVLAAIAAVAAWTLKPPAPLSRAVTRFAFALPDGQQFTNTGRQVVSIAPDGSQFVYVANTRLYLKPMSEMSSILIQGTEIAAGVLNPVFSPDSKSIVFYSNLDRTLKRIAVSGGAAVTICQVDQPFGISWTDDEILVGQGAKGVVQVPALGGQPQTIITLKDGEIAHGPQMLPGGKAILFTLATGISDVLTGVERWNKASIVAQSLTSGERTVLIEGGSDARYMGNGDLVYTVSGTVLAVPFDARNMAITGAPTPVIDGVTTAGITGTSQFSMSNNGSLAFISGAAGLLVQQLTWFDRTGKVLTTVGAPGRLVGLNISPDGNRFAVHRHDAEGADVWVYEDSDRAAMRLTFDASQDNGMPVWSPDGKRIVFQSLRNGKWGLYEKNSDGSGADTLLIESERLQVPMAWSPDGQSIASVVLNLPTTHLSLLRLTGERSATPLQVSKVGGNFPQISPDGKWLAFMSTESGNPHIYVQPFPQGAGKWQVSTGAYGSFPRWRGDGKELFYVTGVDQGEVMSVAVNGSGSSFVSGTPAALFKPGNYGAGAPGHRGNFFTYAVSPDGQRFLMPQPLSKPDASAAPTINVILNWTSLLNR